VRKSKAVTSETVWAALGGALVGYIGWLVAISIGNAFATAGVWSLIVLGLSAVSAVVAALWGRRLRARRNFTLAAFAYALPVLPVLLSLGVLARIYF
jgi:hypothetical protein